MTAVYRDCLHTDRHCHGGSARTCCRAADPDAYTPDGPVDGARASDCSLRNPQSRSAAEIRPWRTEIPNPKSLRRAEDRSGSGRSARPSLDRFSTGFWSSFPRPPPPAESVPAAPDSVPGGRRWNGFRSRDRSGCRAAGPCRPHRPGNAEKSTLELNGHAGGCTIRLKLWFVLQGLWRGTPLSDLEPECAQVLRKSRHTTIKERRAWQDAFVRTAYPGRRITLLTRVMYCKEV